MYRAYYGLKLKPFQISSDPKFLWLGEKHQEALAILKYGILDNRGFLLLTGDVGTGKTTLINALVNSLGPDTVVAHIPDPGLVEMDFFNYIAGAFRMGTQFDTKGAFLLRFRTFLENAHAGGKQILLIVDEAQRLGTTLLEEIRLLSNIELQQTKLINIFFVGQDEFNEILSRDENRALRQRMTLNYHIDPLTEEETHQFIRFRLKVAGTEKKIFTPPAVSEIFSFSGGYPRLINIICDHALLTGYVKGVTTLDAGIIAECAKELRLPKRKADIPATAAPAAAPAALPLPIAPLPIAASAGKRRSFPVLLLFFLLVVGAVSLYGFMGEDSRVSLRGGVDRLILAVIGHVGRGAPETTPSPDKRTPLRDEALLSSSAVTEERLVPETISAPIAPVRSADAEKTVAARVPSTPGIDPVSNPISGPVAVSGDPIRQERLSPGREGEVPASEMNLAARPQAYEVRAASVPVAPEIASRILVRFEFNSNDLTPEAYGTLNDLAAYLKAVPAAKLVIKGYTDKYGSYGYNLSLSNFRANIVKNYLLGHGIDVTRMTALGLGSEDPVDTNDTPEGRNANRRVEIDVKKP